MNMIHETLLTGMEAAIRCMRSTIQILNEVLRLAEEEAAPETLRDRIDELKTMQGILIQLAELTQAALEK